MKISFATDPHSDFESIKCYLKSADLVGADAIILGGDLIDHPFLDEKDRDSYINHQLRKESRQTINDLLNSKYDNFHPFVKEFLGLIDTAHRDSISQYKNLKKIISEARKPVFIVPGNHDTIYADHILGDINLHKAPQEKGIITKGDNEVWIGGYGSANRIFDEIPEELRIPFSESELYCHLKEISPDIVVSHVPPLGFFDEGSMALLRYIKEENPDIVLCGHIHELDNLAMVNDKTLVINPGPLIQKNKSPFIVIDIDDLNGVKSIDCYRIDVDKRIASKVRSCNLSSEKPEVTEHNNPLLLPVN